MSEQKPKIMIGIIDFLNTKNVMAVSFGDEDTEMLCSISESEGSAVMALKTRIGREDKIKDSYSYDDMQPSLVFLFNNLKGIDVFIETLKSVRKDMKEAQK